MQPITAHAVRLKASVGKIFTLHGKKNINQQELKLNYFFI